MQVEAEQSYIQDTLDPVAMARRSLQPLRAFTFVQPLEVQELTITLQGGNKLMYTASQ